VLTGALIIPIRPWLLPAALGAGLISGQVRPPAVSADRLVARVLEARTTSGFRIRARLKRIGPGIDTTRQLLIKGRQDGRRSTVLYEVVGPKEEAGRAVVFDDGGDHHLTGFRIEHGQVTPLTPAAMADPFFDSDLRLDDVAERFWYWRDRAAVGEETIASRRCLIVEFRADRGTAVGTTRVRAWIAEDVAVPLRVERYGADDGVALRMEAGRIVKRHDRWATATLTFEPSGGRGRTIIEGSKWEQDLVLSDAEFTPAGVRASMQERR